MRALIRLVAACAAVACAVTLSSAALADDRAAPDEAKALAIKAAEYIKSAGEDAAYKAFTDKESGWVDRDLYVFVVRNDGVTPDHGGRRVLVGKNLSHLKDVDGKPFIQDIIGVRDEGWVDYKWRNSQTQAVEQKTSYVVMVGDTAVGVGAYKQEQ